MAILRTEPEHDGRGEIREVESYYRGAIEQAQSFLYLENQDLTTHAIGTALERSLRQKQGPEIVLVPPKRCPDWETVGLALLALGCARAVLVIGKRWLFKQDEAQNA